MRALWRATGAGYHLSLGGRRGRSRPLTDTATAAMHIARTVHQTVFDDSPLPSDAGNVLTRPAMNGRRVGAIRISATAPETGAPGSPVRVRATHATANPSMMLPPSASPVAAHGSASPRCAPASIRTAPAVTGASNARARIPVRRTGPVGVTSTTWLAGSSRAKAAAVASRVKAIVSRTVPVAGNATP